MQNDLEAFIVRLPSQLHAKIKSTARSERRSMNNEIVARLETSFEANQAEAQDDNLKTLLLQKIEFLEEKIKACLQTKMGDSPACIAPAATAPK